MTKEKGQASMAKRNIMFLVVVFGIALVYLGAYVYSASQMEVVEVSIEELQNIDASGFDLSGVIVAQNNGFVPVGIEHVQYGLIIGDEELGLGKMQGNWALPDEHTEFPFTARVHWVPSSDLALQLLTEEGVEATFWAEVTLTTRGWEMKVPYERTVDIDDYIQQYAGQEVADVLAEVRSFLG